MSEYGSHWIIKTLMLMLMPMLLLLTESNRVLTESLQDTSNIYTLIAPNEIRSYSLYTVVLIIFNTADTASFEVSLTGPRLNMSMQLHTTYIFPSSSYTFHIEKIEKGNYWLNIKSLSNFSATSSKSLKWRSTKKFVKILTPKRIFRPGQIVQFRAFFHNETMHAIRPDISTYLWLEDSMGYRIKVFHNLIVNNGIFEGHLRLSSLTNLGLWSICVQNDARTLDECIKIRVDNYELSSLSITLDAPTDVNLSDKKFDFVVIARHETDGQVNGPMKITITKPSNKSDDGHLPILVHEVKIVNGEAKITIDLLQLVTSAPDNIPLPLQLTVFLNDTTMNIVQNTSQIVNVWRNGAPSSTLSEQHDYVESLHARLVRLRGAINVIKIDNFGTPLNSLQRVVFQFDYAVNAAHCIILFNGAILQSTMVFPDKKTNEFEIYVELTRNMFPMTKILLYTMEAKSSILLMAAQEIVFEKRVANVFIEQPVIPAPGSDLKLHIRAEANSYVGLVAIDKRVADLALPPDIINNNSNEPPVDVIILTNANQTLKIAEDAVVVAKEEERATTMPKSSVKQKPMINEWVHDKIYMCCDVPKIAQDFNDVWIYNSIHTKSNWSVYSSMVPPGNHNWRLSAFSVDPVIGLTTLKPQPFISAWSYDLLYLSVKLPYSIKVGEILPVYVTCYNWHTMLLEVMIRVKRNKQKFQLVDEKNNVLPKAEFYDHNAFVPSNGTVNTTYYLRALLPGQIDLVVLVYSDERKHILRTYFEVERPPEVQRHQMFYHTVLNIRTTMKSTQMDLPYQPTDSDVICYASGHIIRPILASLSLVTETDNAEQVVSKLIAIYHLFLYLRNKSWCSPLYVKFLEEQLSDGFQTLMRYRRKNGGYSYTDSTIGGVTCESTWLTSYAIQFLQYLEKADISTVKTNSQIKSEQFLLHNRGADGQFEEHCRTPDRRNLTLIELNLEVIKILQWSDRLLDLMQSQQWLNFQLENKINYYYEAKGSFKSINWQKPEKGIINGSWIQYRQELETAARILSKNVKQETFIAQQMEIFQWLLTQKFQNNHKIYCYECSVAEAAIYDYLNALQPQNSLINLKLWINPNEMQTIQINETNQGAEQKVSLTVDKDNTTENKKPVINLSIEGSGPVFVRCRYEFLSKNPSRSLYHVDVRRPVGNAFKCCMQRFKRDQHDYVGTNLNLQLPSGYELDKNTMTTLRKKKLVLQAVPLMKNTQLFLSTEALPPSVLYCFFVSYKRIYTVKNLHNGTVTVYDRNRSKPLEMFSFTLTNA